ncbi:hypothetical protein [Rhodoferax bucti]|uniref:hypothetical protein n=1 Tax=Rhodoferax bucti TaxID=2576305 RepID=UPI001107C16F|nr:hypothetical protein [Rhodoferax bucti]
MSFLSWLTRRPSQKSSPSETSGLAQVDATLPLVRSGSARTSHSVPGVAANRRSERLERRELLYAVVRESMTGAGMLSSSYKFKVLSLDSRGRQYLIMMDMARQNVSDTARLSDIETHIAKIAKTRHDILVTAVYWRVNEHVSTQLSHVKPAPAKQAHPRYEPLKASEVEAFKQAIASVPPPTQLSAPGEIVKSSRRNPQPPPRFADTQLDERASPLSGTQYGDLN